MLAGKSILLGITGGIAAYKAAELCRLFVKAGATVRVVMTTAAKEFISPLTLQTLSKHQVYDDLFAATKRYTVEHVALTKAADLFVVAPATANTIGKIAAGIADNLLTTTILAARCPVLLAPAMNTYMYKHPAQQENLRKLKAWGYHLVEPVAGELACGETGAGKMAAVEEIFAAACRLLQENTAWQGLKVLITAGPTREAIDPIRFLSNHSSGKMGYALAEVALTWGAAVTLVSGPTHIEPPPGVEFVQVTTAQEMYKAVLQHFDSSHVVIKTAAVADYRPAVTHKEKLKKGETLTLELVPNPDILAELGKRKKQQILIGFAAETNNIERNAIAKLKQKNLDFIVANDVTQEGAGFNTDTNQVQIFYADGSRKRLGLMTKKELAAYLLQEIELLRKQRNFIVN
ncbi:MAG: bifunctional phosphopantothenoylcysteine decarboxylase/phosphopantothenate--cysteine ligase CoaBC [Firmicutes bacterium]|nr:bifunctional phosphopantothenoylcysteine decarboxylase/phosphopantothenate--cysteine ligase CoaBC [Bacillota bacterium]